MEHEATAQAIREAVEGGASNSDLVRVLAGVQAAERERCAKKAAPEHIPFSDDEWRVRCEVRDAILEA